MHLSKKSADVRLKQLRVSSSNDAFPPESRTRATHREALIQIKQSLQPYHNSNASPSSVHQNVCTSANSQSTVVQSTPTKTTPSTSAKSDIATVSLQESAMLDYLVNMGFDKVRTFSFNKQEEADFNLKVIPLSGFPKLTI
ncbi:conserved hypothetical protein [Trichinella spiralis]|uniref:hypothetical protein n=1 Tax=Trichinella spiralis TaxID=6334 RepID=UPI0001EFDF0F|nr:conserved hypothetical protein [Trichinella spiralis]